MRADKDANILQRGRGERFRAEYEDGEKEKYARYAPLGGFNQDLAFSGGDVPLRLNTAWRNGATRRRRFSCPCDYGKSPYAAFFLTQRYELRNPAARGYYGRHETRKQVVSIRSGEQFAFRAAERQAAAI